MKANWLTFPVIVLLITFTVNFGLIYLANNGTTQLLEDHPYERGQNYEEVLVSEREFKNSGYSIATSIVKDSQSDLGSLHVKLSRGNSSAKASEVSAKALYLADDKEDRELMLDPVADLGEEFASLPVFRPGVWRIQLQIKTDSNLFKLTRQVTFLQD